MASFYGLEIAKTGLYISQKSINVTGHNIANANTEGYSRQRLITESVDPAALDGRFGVTQHGRVGAGACVQKLDQIRSAFLDREIRRENSSQGYWDVRSDEMIYIESLFNEMSGNSISATMADFFESLHDLSIDPVNEEIRTNLQQNAIKMNETFHHYYNQLVSLQRTQNHAMDVTVGHINDLTASIADYNKQVYAYELSGENANDLRDKRNILLDELSKLVNIDYTETADKHLIVSVEGQELINHTTSTNLETQPVLTGVVSGEPDFFEVYIAGSVFNYSDGELDAYRDMRDGNAADNIGVPRILDNLNTLVRSLAEEFNTVHAAGYTQPYGAVLSHNGVNFFDVPPGGYGDINAGSIALSADVLDSVMNIAASDQLIDMAAANNHQGNNVNALAMVALTTRTDIPVVANFEDFLKSAVVEVGIESSHCQKIAESHKVISQNLDNRKQSISGVSIDEEMVKMVRYQHSYAAASRVITAIDEALDVLINRTGAVGR